ncbi:MAG: transporter substrate-binding domain-containing protein [Deltaproteobacteria bacterium]|nr:transporter substrate-binding domain-containing protein [Deltaproteobacteria bacterium]
MSAAHRALALPLLVSTGAAVALALAVSLAGGDPASADERVLRVGTSGDYAPFSKDGEGFDVDVARLFAGEAGLRIEWVRFRWPDLADRVAAGDFDVAMSGVTWRAERAVTGWMSRAVAAGGPCVIGSESPERVGVNRGGILERWARAEFGAARLLTVDDNASLPSLLDSGEVDAIVTDSFELAHFVRPGQATRCEPHVDRKVYWVAPHRAEVLGPRLDAWLAEREPQLQRLRRRWFGERSPRDAVDHVIDLAARRIAFMPAVAAYKRAHGLPVEDRAREQVVLDGVAERAGEAGLQAESLRESFEIQIDLAKAVQRRAAGEDATLDLAQIRPVLLSLGRRLVQACAAAAPVADAALPLARLEPLAPWLSAEERERMRQGLLLATRPVVTVPAPEAP